MKTILTHAFFQMFHHRVRMYLLLAVFLGGLMSYISGSAEVAMVMGMWFTCILGAGIIGRDVSSGSLHLWFTRPIVRYQYLLMKWLALSLFACGVSAIHMGIGLLIMKKMGATGFIPLSIWLSVLIMIFAFAAMIAAFSTLVPGHGDLALWVGLMLLVGILQWLLGEFHVPVEGFKSITKEFLFPSSALTDSFEQGFGNFKAWASCLAVTACYLSLGSWSLNRKEYSYGTK